jgi:hypothetical protein
MNPLLFWRWLTHRLAPRWRWATFVRALVRFLAVIGNEQRRAAV